MLKWKRIFLILSVVEFAIGFSGARQNIFFNLGLPMGVILFGLFLIAQVFEKESALYDEQHHAPEPARNPGRVGGATMINLGGGTPSRSH